MASKLFHELPQEEFIQLVVEQLSEQMWSQLQASGFGQREPMVSIKVLMDHLNLSKPTVYDLMREEIIPCYRLGKQLRFKLSEVDAALAKAQRKGGKR